MPTLPPKPDPMAFALRLREALERAGKSGRGAGVHLAKRLGVKPPTASAYLAGRHMPEPAKVRFLANELGVDYDWLYFGDLPRAEAKAPRVAEPVALATYPRNISREESSLIDDFRLCTPEVQLSLTTLARAAAIR